MFPYMEIIFLGMEEKETREREETKGKRNIVIPVLTKQLVTVHDDWPHRIRS